MIPLSEVPILFIVSALLEIFTPQQLEDLRKGLIVDDDHERL